MTKIMAKLLTVVTFLTIFGSMTHAKNETFSNLKDDMWEMGLDFEYSYGPSTSIPQITKSMDEYEIEELSAKDLTKFMK